MGGSDGDNGEMGFQHRNESVTNCPSSVMSTNPLSQKVSGMAMSSVSMYKSSSGGDQLFGSGWDPIVSLSQSENFGVSPMVSHSEFASSSYPVVMENQGISSSSHLGQYPSDSSFVEMVPKLPCFGSGNFTQLVSSYGLSESVHISNSGFPPNYAPSKEGGNERTSTNVAQSYEDRQVSDEATVGASPNRRTRKRASESSSPYKNADEELQKDPSGDSSGFRKEQDEKKPKTEQNAGSNSRGKQAAKQSKDNSNSGEAPKEYIHVRAKRGQATNSHSLAERVRREKISERMRLLQELVPGCNKITGKAVMLDEIINYVQSLQQQVEFLSMKLATVNPELNVDIERILSKDILHSRSGGAAVLGFNPGMNTSQPYPHGLFQGTMPSIPSTNPQFPPLHQAVLDHDLQSLFQMGFDSSSAVDNLGPNGRLKSEL